MIVMILNNEICDDMNITVIVELRYFCVSEIVFEARDKTDSVILPVIQY